MTDGAGAHDYSYDPLDRLTAATHPSTTNESYTYDDVGNRTASHQGSSYTYQAFNRLVTANGASFGYDANGNLTSKTDASGSWTYTRDYENRLKQTSRSGGVTVTYSYDAFGRRIQRTSTTGGTTKFVYDGADVLRDLDGNGNTIADYLNGPGIDNKLRQTSGGTALYFIQDHLATTRALADASGSIATNLTYDSFGNLLTGSISTRYTYTGREIDTDTGLMYYRERWYDAQQGRFISEDPIGLDGGLNLYGYVENNPMSLNDPSGLCPPDTNKAARCAALVRRMLRPLEEMKRLLPNYDPAKDFFGGYPIRKRLPGGRTIDLGRSKPRGHYDGIRAAQKALLKNLEAFKRECLDGNDNSNPGLPSDAEKYAYKDIEPPFDPNAPNLFDRVRDWWHNLPPFPTQRELQRSCPWCVPPPILPFPIPIP